jgi:hypothetical protein
MVYLLHFSRSLAHAQHYMGFSDDVAERLRVHASPSESSHHRLMEVIREQGITFSLVRLWSGGRDFERSLKRRKEGRRLCPVCNPFAHRRAARGTVDLSGKQLSFLVTPAEVAAFGGTP